MQDRFDIESEGIAIERRDAEWHWSDGELKGAIDAWSDDDQPEVKHRVLHAWSKQRAASGGTRIFVGVREASGRG
jgi:hypothetical protein